VPSPAAVGERLGAVEGNRTVDDTAPFSALVFKTTTDAYVGKLTYFRVYSGVLHSSSEVLNSRKQHSERVGQIFFLRGKSQVPVGEIGPGDIGAVAKLAVTNTGDTLSDVAQPIVYQGIEFPLPTFA